MSVSILICEDEKPFAKALRLKLEAQGFQVQIANDGQDALEQFSSSFQLVVLDLMLPYVDGFQILEHIRNVESSSVPVLILSNLSQPEDISRVKALGATDYLVKATTPLNDIVGRIVEMVTPE